MPFPAATITSSPMHGPPVLGAGCPTVLIGNKPAWRVTDQHTCPVVNAPPPAGPGSPHGPGITAPPGCITVLVGGQPLTSLTDQIMEPGAVVPPMTADPIMMGVPTVLVP
ncbi:MAG: PAAR domain-containing protein [Rhodothermales bacterium]